MTRLEILCKATGQQGGTIHDFNRRYVCDFLTMSNKDFFKVIYAVYLTRCRQTMPDLYAWPIEETEAVAIRMCNAIDRGSFNKDGAAFKLACKAIGIKHTYKAINQFINL